MAGWRKQHHDPRDQLLATPEAAKLPTLASLRSHMPTVRDQGDLGSCTANAGAVMAEFVRWKETGTRPSRFSRLDLYATTRELEGTPLSDDSGCYVRDVLKALTKSGVCYELLWPYIVSRFSTRPPSAAVKDALHHRATSYKAASTLAQIKQSIVDGYPLIFGFDCFESLMTEAVDRTGMIPMPDDGEANIGGHCVTVVGFDDGKKALEIQNSWGTGWGIAGFGWLPYEYVTSGLASDFWTLRAESLK